MNKRIISLILAFLMLSTFLFTGCDALIGGGENTGNEDDLIKEASNSAMTLAMYIVCEEEVSEETARLVENAFNNITKANFKTQVKLHFATYDEYYEKIESVVKSNEEYALLEKRLQVLLRLQERQLRQRAL